MNKLNKAFLILFIIIPYCYLSPQHYLQHVIQDGENLYRISKKYNVDLKEICNINVITDSSILKPGMELKIPTQEQTIEYSVKKGDNLFRIGLKFNITVTKLCKLNGFEENISLYPGKIIKVPSEYPTNVTQEKIKDNSITSSSFSIPETKISAIPSLNSSSYTIHIMLKGETIYQLSKKYRASIQSILAINNISDSTILKPGASIKIPKNTKSRNFFDYALPLKGRVVPYVKSHYRGVIVFSSNDKATVKAVDTGVVSHIDLRSGYGLIVFLKHDNGLLSTYSGFSEIYVKKDQIVQAGEIIGKPGLISKQTSPAILFSLQDGKTQLNYDMNAGKFYK